MDRLPGAGGGPISGGRNLGSPFAGTTTRCRKKSTRPGIESGHTHHFDDAATQRLGTPQGAVQWFEQGLAMTELTALG